MVESKGYTPSKDFCDLVLKHLGSNATLDQGFAKNVTLKKSEAVRRKELVSEIEYDFQLALNLGKHYLGKAVINFYLKALPSKDELFIDFQAGAINDLVINDTKVNGNDVFVDQRIKLESTHVVKGWNTVMVKYLNPYNTNRVGLHTYIDGSDQEQYLYTQFEAYHCYHVFPVFDQPNLKAKMTLTVTCPQ